MNAVIAEARCRLARRSLIALKWALLDALTAGASPEALAHELGRPWTPELLRQAFPDVAWLAGESDERP